MRTSTVGDTGEIEGDIWRGRPPSLAPRRVAAAARRGWLGAEEGREEEQEGERRGEAEAGAAGRMKDPRSVGLWPWMPAHPLCRQLEARWPPRPAAH